MGVRGEEVRERKKKNQTGKALKKIGYFIIFFPVPQCVCIALVLISPLVGSQEAPWSPVQLRGLHLYKMGGNVVCRDRSLPRFGFRTAAALRLCL